MCYAHFFWCNELADIKDLTSYYPYAYMYIVQAELALNTLIVFKY